MTDPIIQAIENKLAEKLMPKLAPTDTLTFSLVSSFDNGQVKSEARVDIYDEAHRRVQFLAGPAPAKVIEMLNLQLLDMINAEADAAKHAAE